MKYKVGDKVRITTDKSKGGCWNTEGMMDKWLGKVMTVKKVNPFGNGPAHYFMEEDEGEHFIGTGWLWKEAMIDGLVTNKEPRKEEPKQHITITSDGKITTAVFMVDGKEVKKGIAKCSPEDKFNFKTGAELALERMWGKSQKEKHWYFSKEKWLSLSDNAETDKEFREFVKRVFGERCVKSWIDTCDGKPVENDDFGTNDTGYIGVFKISKNWCEYR